MPPALRSYEPNRPVQLSIKHRFILNSILILPFRYIETLRKGEFLPEDHVLNLCNKAKEILIEESNVQRVDTPVTVRNT